MDNLLIKVTNIVFPSLNLSEKNVLKNNLVEICEYIILKLNINLVNFINRLQLDNFRDTKAVINLLLPKFDYDTAKKITFLSDLKLGYSTREVETNKKYLLKTIEVVSDRLCVNWVDIFPLRDKKNIDGTYSEVIIDNDTIDVSKAINSNDKNTMIQAILKYWDKNDIPSKYASSIYYLTEIEFSKTYEVEDSSKVDASFKNKNYFDFFIFMMKDKNERPWFSRYAFDLFSQIAVAHHFLHNKVLLVTGGTGVGKSTLIPRLLWYYNIVFTNKSCKIACTQPRIAPVEGNAGWVSIEMGVPINTYTLKDVVKKQKYYYLQYQHAGDKHAPDNIADAARTNLKFMTDGILINQLYSNPHLNEGGKNLYDMVIVDESHEHNTRMDLILTLMKETLLYNDSIRLIIISATMETDEPRYRQFYKDILHLIPKSSIFDINDDIDYSMIDPAIHVSPPGQTVSYTIKDYYEDSYQGEPGIDEIKEKSIQKVLDLAMLPLGIDKNGKKNKKDILLFSLSGPAIDKACKLINSKTSADVITIPYYAKVNNRFKELVNTPPNEITISKNISDITSEVKKNTYSRKIIVATNVAEASITINTLYYVVDIGKQLTFRYDYTKKATMMDTLWISNQSRVQRKGRVGRTGPGEVYYMYPEKYVINNLPNYDIVTNPDVKEDLLQLLQYFSEDTILDKDGHFYLIHPNEDIIEREKDTGFFTNEYISDKLQSIITDFINNNLIKLYSNKFVDYSLLEKTQNLLSDYSEKIDSGEHKLIKFLENKIDSLKKSVIKYRLKFTGLVFNELRDFSYGEGRNTLNIKLSFIYSYIFKCSDKIFDLLIAIWVEPNISNWTENKSWYTYYTESSKYGDTHVLWAVINKFKHDMKDTLPLEAVYSRNFIKDINDNIGNMADLYVLSGIYTESSVRNNIESRAKKYKINENLTMLQKFDKIVENDIREVKKWCNNKYNLINYNLFTKYLYQLGKIRVVLQSPSVNNIIRKYLNNIPDTSSITNTYKKIICSLAGGFSDKLFKLDIDTNLYLYNFKRNRYLSDKVKIDFEKEKGGSNYESCMQYKAGYGFFCNISGNNNEISISNNNKVELNDLKKVLLYDFNTSYFKEKEVEIISQKSNNINNLDINEWKLVISKIITCEINQNNSEIIINTYLALKHQFILNKYDNLVTQFNLIDDKLASLVGISPGRYKRFAKFKIIVTKLKKYSFKNKQDYLEILKLYYKIYNKIINDFPKMIEKLENSSAKQQLFNILQDIFSIENEKGVFGIIKKWLSIGWDPDMKLYHKIEEGQKEFSIISILTNTSNWAIIAYLISNNKLKIPENYYCPSNYKHLLLYIKENFYSREEFKFGNTLILSKFYNDTSLESNTLYRFLKKYLRDMIKFYTNFDYNDISKINNQIEDIEDLGQLFLNIMSIIDDTPIFISKLINNGYDINLRLNLLLIIKSISSKLKQHILTLPQIIFLYYTRYKTDLDVLELNNIIKILTKYKEIDYTIVPTITNYSELDKKTIGEQYHDYYKKCGKLQNNTINNIIMMFIRSKTMKLDLKQVGGGGAHFKYIKIKDIARYPKTVSSMIKIHNDAFNSNRTSSYFFNDKEKYFYLCINVDTRELVSFTILDLPNNNNIVQGEFKVYPNYYIHDACTKTSYRKQGIMTQILHKIMKDYSDKVIDIEVDDHSIAAKKLYNKLGFVYISKNGSRNLLRYSKN